jgi:hypothetical protein
MLLLLLLLGCLCLGTCPVIELLKLGHQGVILLCCLPGYTLLLLLLL